MVFFAHSMTCSTFETIQLLSHKCSVCVSVCNFVRYCLRFFCGSFMSAVSCSDDCVIFFSLLLLLLLLLRGWVSVSSWELLTLACVWFIPIFWLLFWILVIPTHFMTFAIQVLAFQWYNRIHDRTLIQWENLKQIVLTKKWISKKG